MRAVELFAGGGGASQGLEAAGVEAVACFEYDEAASAVARAAGFPSHCRDVRDVDWQALLDERGPIDLIWASPPCQAFSSAGKRKGASDERNGWPWTVAVLDHLQPRWFMAENVTGLTTHSGEHCGNVDRCPGCYLHRVILPELSKRFAWVGWSVSDAADFGVPQHRRRICIIAGPDSVQWPRATHASPEKCLGLFSTRKPWVTVREALDLDAFVRTYRDLTDEPCTTLAAVQIGNAGPWLERPSPTVVTNEVKGSGPGANPHKMQRASDALFLGTGRRRLTVKECRQLMGWDERYDALLAQQTKTAAYRILGNGCVPAWVEAHARAVLEADER